MFEGKPGTAQAVAAGARCVRTRRGDLLCSFMVQSALGVNNFAVMLAESSDNGETWQEPRVVWPHLAQRQSLFGSLSRSESGDLFLYGITIPISRVGETFWSDANQGMKQNSLFWAHSRDDGRAWTEPKLMPLPYPGSAEAPGPLCATRPGAWLACYAPYNTFDPQLKVERDRIIVMRSEDHGSTWSAQPMIRFKDRESGGAEAWVVELSDGRLLGTCWNTSLSGTGSLPNAFALSTDGGRSWHQTGSTGIAGQSTSLLALPDGRALMAYNQRKHGEPGVWIAEAQPSPNDFGLRSNQLAWKAALTTRKGTSGEHDDWQDFAFGEPCLTWLGKGELLLTLWSLEPSAEGILFVKLRMIE